MANPMGGGLALLFDSFRFHRLRREWAARLLFLICLVVNLPPVLLPLGQGFLFLANDTSTDLAVKMTGFLSHFDRMDTLWLAASIVAPLLSLFLALVYANLHVDDLQNRKDGQPVRRTLRALPRLLALFLLVALLCTIGGIFFIIPGLILLIGTCLSPLLVTVGRRHTVEAIMESYGFTRRNKFRIALFDLTIVVSMGIPATLLALPFAAGDVTGAATGAISAFFGAMSWMMLGRLHGKLYHLLVTQAEDVIPSSEKHA